MLFKCTMTNLTVILASILKQDRSHIQTAVDTIQCPASITFEIKEVRGNGVMGKR